MLKSIDRGENEGSESWFNSSQAIFNRVRVQSKGMHKEELIQLHGHLATIMDYFVQQEEIDVEVFSPYEVLDVNPSHVHKSKSEHKHAVFVLGQSLANAMSDYEFSNAGRLSKRMGELAEDAERRL